MISLTGKLSLSATVRNLSEQVLIQGQVRIDFTSRKECNTELSQIAVGYVRFQVQVGKYTSGMVFLNLSLRFFPY